MWIYLKTVSDFYRPFSISPPAIPGFYLYYLSVLFFAVYFIVLPLHTPLLFYFWHLIVCSSFTDESPALNPWLKERPMGTRRSLPISVSFLFCPMPVHEPVNDKGVYFITFTCFNWLPLIELIKGYDLVYNFFDVMKANSNHVLGYVIMPNHVHLRLHYTNTKQSLNTIIGNGKRFIGYGIVSRLEKQDELVLLNQMKEAVTAKDRQRNKKHQVWQGTFDVKECRTEKFILQKLNYIHNNPRSGRWKLCEKPYQYPHSSAKFYNGDKTGYEVKDYWDVLAELNYSN